MTGKANLSLGRWVSCSEVYDVTEQCAFMITSSTIFYVLLKMILVSQRYVQGMYAFTSAARHGFYAINACYELT